MCFFLCRSWYSNLPIVGETWAGSPLEEGLVAPFLTSHPPPCTSRCVFYLPEHHLLLPSICLVQLPARFLYLVCVFDPQCTLCASLVVPSIYLVLPPTRCLPSLPYTFYHADPSCPLPSPHSAQPRAAHNAAVCFGAELQQCSIRQKCIRRRSQALGGLGRRGCYLGQQPIAAHPRLYPLSMQHATLSSNHIQTSTRSSVTEREIAPYFS